MLKQGVFAFARLALKPVMNHLLPCALFYDDAITALLIQVTKRHNKVTKALATLVR